MVEVSEVGFKEEELELDLGLSIGGCFRKSEKSKPVGIDLGIPFVSRSNSVEVDLRLIENQTTLLRSSASSEIDSGNETVDWQTRREIQALRRQVAKNKQQEKICRGRNSVIENAIEGQRASKREKTDSNGFENNGVKNVNLNMYNGQTENHPVHPVQYNYPPVQFVPYKNGFAYPFLMPCWNPSGNEKNRVEPANCQGFRPFLPHQSLGLNGKREGNTEKTTSNGSPVCSTSSVSDHLTSSHEGGGTSDTGTNSSCSFKDQQKGCTQNPTNCHSEQSACSPGTEFAARGNEQRTNYNEKVMPKLFNHLNSIRSKEETTSQTGSGPLPFNKSRLTREALSPSPLRAAKVDCGKPPKPQARAQNQNTPTLPQMPYVSATGNGPNGTTVTGLLYRYTKSEVCIVCICHGSTFSPAEFVQHAGGTDITNPLKHITVIPS